VQATAVPHHKAARGSLRFLVVDIVVIGNSEHFLEAGLVLEDDTIHLNTVNELQMGGRIADG
jgi:hypothetical protein